MRLNSGVLFESDLLFFLSYRVQVDIMNSIVKLQTYFLRSKNLSYVFQVPRLNSSFSPSLIIF